MADTTDNLRSSSSPMAADSPSSSPSSSVSTIPHFFGFYKGVIPGVTGSLVSGATYFSFIESTKKWIKESHAAFGDHWAHFLASSIGDTFCSFMYGPCEVMKQWMQIQGTRTSWSSMISEVRTVRIPEVQMYDYYPGMLQAGRLIWKKQGTRGLYAGHPFSITSGPKYDHIYVHIRALGDWSNHIHILFQETVYSKLVDFPKVHIDGPYGAASQDHVKYEIVLMIGLGVGVTPFISILKDIGDKLQNPPTNHVDDVEIDVPQRPLKAYLYWITREVGSLGWFRDDMNEICKLNQEQNVIEMHNFSTSVYPSGDARLVMISLIQALYYSKTGIDIFSQTPVRTHFSQPNWFKIFSKLAQKHAGSCIGVFFCGPSNLGKELKDLCTKFSIESTTTFVFHDENYQINGFPISGDDLYRPLRSSTSFRSDR